MINKSFFKKLLPDNTKKWTIFSVCILTATVFWVFLTFSRSFEYSLDFKLDYTGKPVGKVQVNEPLSDVRVRVKGQGFELFNYTLLDKKKVIAVDISQFSKKQRGSMTVYSLNLEKEGNDLFGDKNSELKAVAYSVDTLKLVFDEVVTKKLKVEAAVKLTVDSSLYLVQDVLVIPDSVQVRGSKFLLQNLDTITTYPSSLIATKDTSKFVLGLEKPSGVLKLAVDSIKFDINLISYESHSLSVPVKCQNCPDSVSVKLFPSFAEVSFTATKSLFNELKVEDFSVIVDYDEIEKSSDKVFIKLLNYPSGVQQLRLSPAKAEFLLRQK